MCKKEGTQQTWVESWISRVANNLLRIHALQLRQCWCREACVHLPRVPMLAERLFAQVTIHFVTKMCWTGNYQTYASVFVTV